MREATAPNQLIKCDLLFLRFVFLILLCDFRLLVPSNWIINVDFFLSSSSYSGVHCSDTVGGAVCGSCPQGDIFL